MKASLYIILVLTYLLSNEVHSQEKKLDDLKYLLSTAKTVRNKIDILNDFADTLCLHKKDTGRILALEALRLSKQEKYLTGIGDANHSLGLIKFRRDNDSAIYYFFEAKKAYQQTTLDFEKTAFLLNNISRAYDELLKFDSSLYWAREAIDFVNFKKAEKQITSKWRMYSYGALANAHAGKNNYDSSAFYYVKAVKAAEYLRNEKMLEVYFKGLAGIQAQLGNYHRAIEFGKKALGLIKNDERALTILLSNLGIYHANIGDYDNAARMADSSLKTGRRSNVHNMVGRNYIILGMQKMKEMDYAGAMRYYKEGLIQAKKLNNSLAAINNLKQKIGEAYQALDSLSLAKEYYQSAIETSGDDYNFASKVYFLLAKLAYSEGDYLNAFKQLQQYQLFHDSVYSIEKVKTIEDLNAKYQSEKKEQQVLLLTKDKELQKALLQEQLQQIQKDFAIKQKQQLLIDNYELEEQKKEQIFQIQQLSIENSRAKQKEQEAQIANTSDRLALEKQQKELSLTKIKNQRIWLALMILAFSIVSVVSFLLFSRYKLLRALQSQRQLSKERHRISRDLHDEIGATLSGIAMYSHLAKTSLSDGKPDEATNSVNIIQHSATEMVTKLNDIIWLINPGKETLDDVIAKLKEYAQNMCMASNITLKVEVSGETVSFPLPIEIRKNIYLLCKEAVNNAAKYSNASSLMMTFCLKENNLEINIKDDGKGFDITTVKQGNGLENMQKRAKDIGGNLQLITCPGNGTHWQLSTKITHQGIA